jgi:hypothetical protein
MASVTSTLPGCCTAASCDKFTEPQGCEVDPRLVAKSPKTNFRDVTLVAALVVAALSGRKGR